MAVMPGAIARPALFGLKTVAKFPGAAASHVGTVQLYDSASGALLAIIEGASLTAIRTAAASALATDVLAREDARVLAVLGTGEQARRHLVAMRAVRRVREVRIWGRDGAKAAALAATLDVPARACARVADAVEGADIICATTAAVDPVLFGADVAAGAHVNLVGSAIAATAEADGALVARAAFFVDYREAALAQAGELRRAVAAGLVTQSHVRGEIGEVLLGRVPGRADREAVTIYKSLGVTAQDLAAGAAVLAAARAAGRGLALDLMA
jgi:ornithine cyclodeaminase